MESDAEDVLYLTLFDLNAPRSPLRQSWLYALQRMSSAHACMMKLGAFTSCSSCLLSESLEREGLGSVAGHRAVDIDLRQARRPGMV
ncbi:hypothetical protein RRG08_024066 [Elysia crispata]|uniref:Uncharacterized protein n=1 Tax=Elysia crispata TaxID=231223 RepID=A0AAE0ZPY4_9GAST|nr:hypothetical protein RRG08_024066 [Elysia crispata]